MYRQYKALPEFNRVCIKAARDRAYQQHMDALKRMRPCVDTRQPVVPQTIGRNYKRYENEQQRNATIQRDNKRLLTKINDVQREEHYPRSPPQRPYTLMGQAQKDEMWRITHENRKLLTAVQERKPTLNRNDWLMHRLDHQYQITKMSEFKRTVPMGEIIRQEQVRTSQKSRPSTTAPSTASRRTTSKKPKSTVSYEDEDQRLDAGMMRDGLTGKQEQDEPYQPEYEQETNDDLKLDHEMMKDGLTGEMEEEKTQEEAEAPTDDNAAASEPAEESGDLKLDHEMMKDGLTGEMAEEKAQEDAAKAAQQEEPKESGGLLLDPEMIKDALDGDE